MHVTEARISNYKSLETEKNRLIVQRHVTSLIGKNESGKSNILSAMEGFDLIHGMNPKYFDGSCQNRNSTDPIAFELTLEIDEDEIEIFGKLSPTKVKFDKADNYSISGGVVNWINPSDLQLEISSIKNELIKQQMTQEQRNHIDNMLAILHNFNNYTLKKNKDAIAILLSNAKDERLKTRIQDIMNRFEKIEKAFPAFSYLRDIPTLKKIYSIDLFNKKPQNPLRADDPLLLLLQIIGYQPDKIREMLGSTAAAQKANFFNRLNEKIDTEINRPFSKFYDQEKITLEIGCDGTSLVVYVKSNGTTMDITERSNGLQWYLNHFIQLRYKKKLISQNVVFLLDEPGVHLHVNAQKDILMFLYDLTHKHTQIIYTTHSPFMINVDDLGSVRALEKDEHGCTQIYNCVFNAELSPISKMDTLSPITQALGMDLKHCIGPRSDSANIITEGISEYYYLYSMIKYLGLNTDKICIMPANGADAIIHVCSILIGWGYNFSVLYDLDSKGVSACKEITTKFCLEVNDKVHFLIDVDKQQWKVKSYYESNKCEIENLITEDILKVLRTPAGSGEPVGKMIAAKRFYDGILAGTITPDKKTIEKFTNLFTRLGITNNQKSEHQYDSDHIAM